jgi:hypothetical protein
VKMWLCIWLLGKNLFYCMWSGLCHYEISKNLLESKPVLTLVSTSVLMSASMSLLAQCPHQHPCQRNDEVVVQYVTFIFRHKKWAWAGLSRHWAQLWWFQIVTDSVNPWRFSVNRYESRSMTLNPWRYLKPSQMLHIDVFSLIRDKKKFRHGLPDFL